MTAKHEAICAIAVTGGLALSNIYRALFIYQGAGSVLFAVAGLACGVLMIASIVGYQRDKGGRGRNLG